MVRRRKFRLPTISLTLPRASRALFRSMNVWSGAIAPVAKTTPLGRVIEITNFGSNPGQLRMYVYTPKKSFKSNAPLIVLLHGCGQYAEPFAETSGWIALANHFGIPLLLPEQVMKNNSGRCFNWYRNEDRRRGRGEAMSIRQMVRAAVVRFHSDKSRVFIVGLSAGGALAAALLAAYPAVFNAGAIVAGMPVGAANNAGSALLRMHRANPLCTRAGLARAVLAEQKPSTQRRKWPRLSIWHGGIDRTIDPANGEALAAQWTELLGFDETPSFDDVSGKGIRRRSWGKRDRPLVEFWTLPEMGHGFPIDAATPGAGRPGFGVVDAGIAGAYHIAAFWGLAL